MTAQDKLFRCHCSNRYLFLPIIEPSILALLLPKIKDELEHRNWNISHTGKEKDSVFSVEDRGVGEGHDWIDPPIRVVSIRSRNVLPPQYRQKSYGVYSDQ